jgi:hypothetical protein
LKCMSSYFPRPEGDVPDLATTDPMQLVDELSMIYTTCLMCYVTFSFGKTSMYRSVLASSLVGLSLFITLYYHVSESIVITILSSRIGLSAPNASIMQILSLAYDQTITYVLTRSG